MLVAPLLTAGVTDEVAQELQMPIGPQMMDDVEEPMPARPATLKDPGTPDRIVQEQHSLTNFPSQPWCKMFVESRGHMIHRIENSRKSRQLCLNFSLTTGTLEMEAIYRLLVSSWEETPLLEPSTRRWCQTPRRWTCQWWLQQPSRATWSMNACLHGDKEGALQPPLDKAARECRPANSAASVTDTEPSEQWSRGGSRLHSAWTCSYLAVLKDKLPVF